MGKNSSKRKHQGKKTTESRADRRARRRAQRSLIENIKNGTEDRSMSKEKTPVRVHNVIELIALVAESDYKHNLMDWHDLTNDQQEECKRDAYTPSKDDERAALIYIQKWLIRKDESEHHCLQVSLNELMGRSWIVIDC